MACRYRLALGACAVSLLLSACYESHLGSGLDPRDSSTIFPDTSTDSPPFDSTADSTIGPIDGSMDSDVPPEIGPRDTSPTDTSPDVPRDTSTDVPPIDAGRASRALRFERGDRVFVTPSVTLDITDSHTYELWVRPRRDGLVLHKGEVSIGGRYQYLIEVREGAVIVGWSTEVGDALARGRIVMGVWTHISVVIDADPMIASLTLYVNGTEVASSVFVNSLFNAINDRPLLMGGFEGDIDEVRLFTFARSGPAIRSTLSTRLSPPPPGMEAYWPLEETGQIVLDRSLRGNEGVLGDLTFPDPADPVWILDGAIR